MTEGQNLHYILYLLFPADEIRMFDCPVTPPYSTEGTFPRLFPYILKNTLAYRACSTYSGPMSLVFVHFMLEILKGTKCYSEILL